jgi:transposase
MPPDNTRPVRVCSQGDSRVGWLTVRRRRLTARGVHPAGAVQHVCAWFYVDGAVAPTTGERFCLALPYLTAETCHLLVKTFAHASPDRLNRLLLDHRGAHPAQHLTIPAHGRLVFFPPDAPELNPMERVWREVKDDLAWQQFMHVEAQPDFVGQLS